MSSHTVIVPKSVTLNNVNYNFERWEDGSINTTRTLNLTNDITITASYSGAPAPPPSPGDNMQVTFSKNMQFGGIDPEGTVTVPSGSNSFMLHPYEGAHLTTIDVTGGILLGNITQHGTTPDFYYIQEYTATGDGTVTVNFALDASPEPPTPTPQVITKTFSGNLSAIDKDAKISGVPVKIAVTGDIIDNLTATTDSQGKYTMSKDYTITATTNCSATTTVDADTTNESASTSPTIFQIIYAAIVKLKRALTLMIT